MERKGHQVRLSVVQSLTTFKFSKAQRVAGVHLYVKLTARSSLDQSATLSLIRHGGDVTGRTSSILALRGDSEAASGPCQCVKELSKSMSSRRECGLSKPFYFYFYFAELGYIFHIDIGPWMTTKVEFDCAEHDVFCRGRSNHRGHVHVHMLMPASFMA